jgi:RNA polymerase sigma factor (sigma-70 family)
MTASLEAIGEIRTSRQDDALVQECRKGNEEAWSTLIDKYKNLIFSIPIKLGFSPDDAAEIFQAVCLGLLQELPQLREPRALPAWLIRMTSHKCFRLKREQRYTVPASGQRLENQASEVPEALLYEIEREQIVREGLAALSPDCDRLVQLLFYEDPPVPYEEAAKRLGMAKGSIGATRMRCLEKLRLWLEKRRFR